MAYTPLHIDILFHYYISPGEFERRSETAREYTKHLIQDDLLTVVEEPKEDSFRTIITSKGRAHIAQILQLALPVQAYVGADGKVLNLDALNFQRPHSAQSSSLMSEESDGRSPG